MEDRIYLEHLEARQGVFASLFLISTRLETVGNQILGELTTKQWFMLAAITTCFHAPPTISEVASCIGLSHQNVKQMALRLQEKEFLTLQRDTVDSRAWRIVVTCKLGDYEKHHRDQNALFLEKLFRGLDKNDVTRFLHLLLTLLQNLEQTQNDLDQDATHI